MNQLGRPVGADSEETRRRIITAAMRCVAEVGYSQASIREIARAADMTSGSLYHYFPNKSELLHATGKEIEEIVLPRLRSAAGQREDVIDRLDAVLDESTRLVRDYPYLTGFLRALRAAGTAESPGSKALHDVVFEIIDDARQRGTLSGETDTRSAVEAICALARGLSEQADSLPAQTYQAALGSAKSLIRGTLFTQRVAERP
ncbi:TetR family transcriptional regulator [Mycobacterium florentinum]|uniref:TetR family transcriptional regulator n=1 Tax=Mycobacterium florentinum TaxID=292462 RepID=A0A1X1U5N8_MYCFL|nr:TetR/AcrR family transcriptional regulator [Mycobacterium florentinum]ORV52162.1 TetR family transcriptional regulator [Mycobacterium florentinum]BBX79546.1 TetR family transcriptional regulator [Mycobacterium florentinum]